ncbi:MAG: formate--tetrahydrofolate ligase [Elusimicrobia bacterium]|nr:formate--tetrahydrofolate ligase [Elusimicrobiota bacterium]MBU2614675.1 formate--tetrahydrofolate ligase [Elusimicrobiota bacterium]
MKTAVPSDLEIAQSIKLKPITEIAKSTGINEDELELYGNTKAKIKLETLKRIKNNPQAKYVDVTAITPTPLGEGKTVTTIGASLGLAKIGKKVITCIRQPSLGPVFGIKGGAAGGGYSQVLPMEDFNLHLTGDVHAISLAHNLGMAFLNNAIYRRQLDIDQKKILWRYVVDISDRFLRNIVTGLGTTDDGIPLSTGFDISVASEIMAILALTTDLKDMRKKIGKMVMAFTHDNKPVTAEDLKVAGAMTALMVDAIKPTLLQTTEYTPCFVHAGPFANIAHGNSSIIADQIAVRLSEYVVTESGFGADIGMEKFMNIKCRYSGLVPNCVVMVCSIRALKMHSGKFKVVAGKPLDEGLIKENLGAIEEGICNLEKQIENARLHGVPVVVAINKFSTDTDNEIKLIEKKSKEFGAEAAVLSEVWEKGGNGGKELADAIVKACEKPVKFQHLYSLDMSIKDKIHTIATKIYGAKDVQYSALAEERIKLYTQNGWDKLPICMAKTHLSLSHDPTLKGRPKGFTLTIRDIRASIGAGFLYPLCGEMRTMPGLPSVPAGTKIDIDDQGRIVGLF